MNASLVILAAGLSTRYGRPKALEPLGPAGETLLDYIAFEARRHGFLRVTIVVREEMAEAVRRHLEGRWPGDLRVGLAFQRLDALPEGTAAPPVERVKPWGTGHAVLCAGWDPGGVGGAPFAVLNADDLYGPRAFRRAAGWLEAHGRAGMRPLRLGLVGYRLRDTLHTPGAVSRGICRAGRDGRLRGVVEPREIHACAVGLVGR